MDTIVDMAGNSLPIKKKKKQTKKKKIYVVESSSSDSENEELMFNIEIMKAQLQEQKKESR